jgi:hypothetical protein
MPRRVFGVLSLPATGGGFLRPGQAIGIKGGGTTTVMPRKLPWAHGSASALQSTVIRRSAAWRWSIKKWKGKGLDSLFAGLCVQGNGLRIEVIV